MANTLKIGGKYFNSYEAAHSILKNNPWYNQNDWINTSRRGELDQYITMLSNTDKIVDKDKFYKDYSYDYLDDKSRLAALYNETLADKTNVDTERTRYAKDAAGNYLLDDKGKPIVETFTASDYDYYKEVLKNSADENYKKYLKQQEQERKDSMSGFGKFMASIPAVLGEYVIGFADQVDNLLNTVGAIGNGIGAIFTGEKVTDAIANTMASDTFRSFEILGLQDLIIDFESKYTHIRDIDGNYSSFGKYVGGVANSLGQMLPSLLLGKAAGTFSEFAKLNSAGKLLNGAAHVGGVVAGASAVPKVVSSLTFYQGTMTGNVRDMYNDMAKNYVSIPSGEILANAAIKSGLQWAVEVGLGKVLGGTAIDNLVFGRSVSAGGKSLTTSAAKRLFKDFTTEGLEEVLQDTSDFLVDRAFITFLNEDFGKIANSISLQSLVDAFFIGGIASFAGSARQILTTRRMETPNVYVNKKGQTAFRKLNKLASWEYGLNMQSFVDNFTILQEQGHDLFKEYDTTKDKEGRKYAAAFTEMYAAYRMISSIYNEIGDERFKAANDILTEITSMINKGKFSNMDLKSSSTQVMETLKHMQADSIKMALDKLKNANITKSAISIERGDNLEEKIGNESTRQQIKELFDGDPDTKKILLTEDGNNIVTQEDTMFIPLNYVNNTDASAIYATIAEQTLVENILKGKYKGLPLDTITSAFKQVTGNEEATTEEAIYNVIFNDSFFKIVLSTANKDVYNFVSSLSEIINSLSPKKLKDTVYKQKLSTVLENMKASLFDYLTNQQNADHKLDIFTEAEQRKIAGIRWSKNLYARVINNTTFKKLTDADWIVLNNRVNSLPLKQFEKDTILKNLKSESSNTRTSAMNRIAKAYAGIFTTNYDGKIYMPDTSIPNRTFNMFLQNQGITIETLLNYQLDKSLQASVTQVYGEFTKENLIKFRQTQFMKSCNYKYTFRYDKQGKIGVYEASTNKQVGFSAYHAQQDSLSKAIALDKRTTVERGNKKNFLVKDILNPGVDDATAAYLSIDDVITDPSLLNEQIQANIQLKYGDITIESTFLYLREHFLKELGSTTVIALSDGSYAFGDVRPMLDSLKSKDIVIDKHTRITQLIRPSYLYGRLSNISIKLTDSPDITAQYNSSENTIYINSHIAKQGGDLLKFAFLHEFQHAIQTENNMTSGLNYKWLKLKYIPKSTKQNIINDVRKHRPELFENVTKGSQTEEQIVNDFVYYASGESTAYGADATSLVDFYPIIVSDDNSGTKIMFPWGTKYNLTNKLPLSLVSKFGKFDIPFTDEQKAIYKQFALKAYDEITNGKDNKVLKAFEIRGYPAFVKLFTNVLAVTDDHKFIIDFYNYLDDNLLDEDFDEALDECWNILNARLTELKFFAKGIQNVDKVATIKQYSLLELKDLFFKYNTNISIEPFATQVFDTISYLSRLYYPDIKVTNWVSKQSEGTIGYQYRDIIRYDVEALATGTRTSAAQLYLHEAIHFITSPIFEMYDNENLRQHLDKDLQIIVSEFRDILLQAQLYFNSTPFKYRVSSMPEFASGRSDRRFIEEFKNLKMSHLYINMKDRIERITTREVNTFYDAYIAIVDYLVKYPGDITSYYGYYKGREYYYKTLTYPDTHNGKFEDIQETNGRFYRISEDGEVIFEGEPNFEKRTFVDTISNVQSFKATTENDRKAYNQIVDKVIELRKTNKKITSSQVFDKLKTSFPFYPSDILLEAIKDVVGDAKVELDELDKSLENSIEETEVKKPQDNSKAKKPSKRYVTQKEGAGTNLERYGYTAKYKKTQLSEELKSFIVNATENIDTELWNKVKSGKLTTQDILDYLRDANNIGDETFKLINNSYFHNNHIKSLEELKRYIINKTPKYYAMRALVKRLGYGNLLMANTNPNLLDKFESIIEKDEELKTLYDNIINRYYTYKGDSLDISEKNLRRLWMQYFDGSAQSAGYLAAVAKAGAINKWLITGESSTRITKSLQDKVGDDMEIIDVIEDTSSSDAFDAIFYSTDREQRIDDILKIAGPKYVRKLLSKGYNEKQVASAVHKKAEQLRDMDEKEFARQYAKIVRGMSEEEINSIFAKQLIAESAGLDVNKLSDKEIDNLSVVTGKILPQVTRPSNAIVNNIRSIVRTIKSNLSKKEISRFLKENSDIFTDDFNIKSELLRETNNKGQERYLDPEKLLPLEDRIRQLSKDVRANAYESSRSLNFKKQMEKQIKELERQNAKLINDLANGKGTQVIHYTVADDVIEIQAGKPVDIPPALLRILSTGFNKVRKSKTEYIIEGEKDYIASSYKTFITENAEYLNTLEQADIDAIADFYLNAEIMPATNKAQIYSAIQVYMLGYLIKSARDGKFTLDEDVLNKLENRLELIVNVSAKNLANWKQVRKELKPEEVIIQSMAKSCNIEFSTGDVQNLLAAIKTRDIQKIEAAKSKMYKNGLRSYKGTKSSFFERLFRFERMAMLSGPGTMIRNKVSNTLVTYGNLASEKVGANVSSLIEKLFPKKKWKRDNQYKIHGTVVTSEVQTFIKNNIIDNGFLNLVSDGMNKYDPRKHKDDDLIKDSMEELVIASIRAKIFQEHSFKSEILNKTQKVIMKFLSDDKSINKAAVRYFGKILVEDNVDISKGLTTDVLNHFAEAYKLAAHDYMHKTNFFNKIEGELRKHVGDGAYFAYKQLLPFAPSSWNWFVEALKYTPVGLVNSVIQFAKLETYIDKLDEKRRLGAKVVSSRFAEYLTRRDIGKGVIGTIGFTIGSLLALFGYAGIDEEDDKYKLFVNIGDDTVAVDISDIFGSQGVLLGITLFSSLNGEGDVIKAAGNTLDTMFNDNLFSDVFNSFRYNENFGEWLIGQPFNVLNMFIPNLIKTFTSSINKYKITYSKGILGRFERIVTNTIPGLVYAFPKQLDPYTGEKQIAYKMPLVTNIANKLLPFKIYPYNVTDIEKVALSLDVHKSALTGRYEINNEKLNLTTKEIEELNEFYGKLNKEELEALLNNKTSYKVWDEKQNKYLELKYTKMTDEQKKTVIERIMSNNSQLAKVYILTSKYDYKYYGTESEYERLKELKVNNVYRKTDKLNGFIN